MRTNNAPLKDIILFILLDQTALIKRKQNRSNNERSEANTTLIIISSAECKTNDITKDMFIKNTKLIDGFKKILIGNVRNGVSKRKQLEIYQTLG